MSTAVNVDQALFAKLSNDAGVLAIVASPVGVYMGLFPENASYPAVNFLAIAETDPNVSHQGASGSFRTRYQFTCWGKTMTDTRNVARAVKACLHGFRGDVDGYDLGPCLLASSVSLFDSAENVFQTHVDFIVWNQG
jgi:Protein of unknown function (DUF3168)